MDNIQDDTGYNQVWAANEASRLRAKRRADFIISRGAITSADRVLEIGCGLGTNAFLIARKTGAKVLATDLCVPFIQRAQEKFALLNLHYEIRDFTCAKQFEGETFDLIVGDGILHHLYPKLDESFARMRSLLNAEGRIVFFEPNICNPYVYFIFRCPSLRRWARLEPSEMAFSKGWITDRLERAGFRNISVQLKDFSSS